MGAVASPRQEAIWLGGEWVRSGCGVGSAALYSHCPSPPLQPPAEAVNLARMLSQSQPVDLEQRIEQVASVVRGRTEDEISIALHDNDYDPDRAVAALLDEDGGNVTVSGAQVESGT